MNLRQVVVLFVLAVAIVGGTLAFFWDRQQGRAITLTLATGIPNSGFYDLGERIAEAVRDADPHVTIRVVSTEGSDHNISLLKAGGAHELPALQSSPKDDPSAAPTYADLAIVQNDTHPTGLDVHTLLPLHRGVFHFLVRQDAEIASIYDLRGKRVGVGSTNSGNLHVVRQLFHHFGMQLEEVTALKESFRESAPRLQRGEVDAVLVLTAINSPALVQFVRDHKVRYVSLATTHGPGNEVDGFAVTYPYVERYTIPQFVYPLAGTRQGIPEEPCETFALRSSLVCRGDLPDDVARAIVSAIVSHRTSMMRDSMLARDITEHFDADELQFPVHHGAMAYFQRQRPSFLERYSEPMAFILSLFLALCGLVAAFNKWVVVRKKNRIDRYYSRLDELLTELNTESLNSARLDSIEQELLSVRHDAVRELVREQLLADDSFQIFQSLLTDCHQQLSFLRRTR